MIGETFLERFRDDVDLVGEKVFEGTMKLVPRWKHAHPPVRNVNQALRGSFTPLERIALAVTVHVGSPGFFLVIVTWTAGWLGWNLLNRHAELRAEADFEVNQKAEKEIEAILLHLEHQTAAIERQGELILQILRHLDAR